MTLEKKDFIKILKYKELSKYGDLDSQIRQFGSVHQASRNRHKKQSRYGMLILEDLLIDCEKIDHSIRGVKRKLGGQND